MITEKRAIDIALDSKHFQPSTANLVVVPVTSTESLAASRGLPIHIEKLYDAVYNKSSQDRAVEEVFNFLSTDAEAFLQRARNLQKALDPEKLSPYSRAYAAAGIAYLIRGQHAHKTGVWLRGKAADKQVREKFYEINEADDLTFHEYSEWAFMQSIKNEIYWKRQLEAVGGTYHLALLKQAINESDHYLFEV